MLRVLCWDPHRVSDVINIEADSMDASVFRAVDTDAAVLCRAGEKGAARETTTGELLQRFLDPDSVHMQMAVLGPSGAGKSHLIRRLENRLEGRAGIEVLVIQRLETNLRAILEKLVRRLPAADRAPFEEELRHAGHALTTPDVQRAALLDGLAQAVQEDGLRSDSGIEVDTEAWLLEHLPDLLRDPYLRREKFLRPDQPVPELVDRLFSNREGKRLDERVVFEAANLPLQGIRLEECAGPVRDVVHFCLYDQDKTIPPVLTILNRNLDRAIARTLNFSGERLIELMGTLRVRLGAAKKVLVLLFEEFARLQGYDGAMLEALLLRGGTGEGMPCGVRWAIACTSGRFRELPETVRSRMDLVVDMEVAAPDVDLADFSGRYLNAVRLGREGLAEALREGATTPNRCESCEWRPECHVTFGRSSDGYGLYPFTAGALSTMALRVEADAARRFNPRTFQRNVLRAVLAPDEALPLLEDAFPTKALLHKFGGPSVSATDNLRLHERAGGRFERYLTLYELWCGGVLRNPSDGVLRAFALDPLPGLETPTGHEATTTGPTAPAQAPASPKTVRAAERKRQIGGWAAGGTIDPTLAHRLRVALFPLIEQAIDWDLEGLAPTTFSGATGSRPFRQTSVNFYNQAPSGKAPPAIVVELPLRRDAIGFANAARALETLVAWEETRDWSEAGGLDALAGLRELVDECAGEIIRQLHALRLSGSGWDPVASAVDLLLVGAALGGTLGSQPDDAKFVEATFANTPDENNAVEGRLRRTYDALRKSRDATRDLLRAHLGGTKGGRVGGFIDPSVILSSARRLRKGKWVLSGAPPTMQAPYTEVASTYARVLQDLHEGLVEERARRLGWLERVEAAFGAEENRQRILDAVSQVLDAAAAAALPTRRKALEAAKAGFAGVQFADACRAAKSLKAADPPETELAAFARGRDNAVKAVGDLIAAWSDFLDEAESEVSVQRQSSGLVALEAERTRLEASLDRLTSELSTLEDTGDVA